MTPRLAYRPELDAIRGAAIALVVVQHFVLHGVGAERLAAPGALGVTLFFVLSGYLITSLLLAERRTTGRVSLRAFYERRVRRLMPALAIFLVVIAVVGLPGNVPLAALYLGNWGQRFAPETMGYVTHTWTLGIEEQFYLVWPLVFMALWRWPRIMVGVLVAASVASIAFRDEIGSVMRADALGAGALLAIWGGRLPRWIGVVGWAWIAYLATIRGVMPSWVWTAGMLASAAIVGSAAAPSWRWLVWLGTISYGLYLWNYPVARLVGSMSGGAIHLPAELLMGIGVALSVCLAIISERWVERPFRRRRLERRALVEDPEVERAPDDRRNAPPSRRGQVDRRPVRAR